MPPEATSGVPEDTDIAVAGGGPVGSTLALALRAAGRRATLIERRPHGTPPAAGFRPIALSHASRLILERVGVWSLLSPTPIETIRVTQSGAPGRVVLEAADAGVPALGYVVAYADLDAAFGKRVGQAGVSLREGAEIVSTHTNFAGASLQILQDGRTRACATRCVVHAEGSPAPAQDSRPAHAALTARVTLRGAGPRTAYEHFSAQGPLALLPLAGDHALVWSASPEAALELAALPDADFLEALARTFGPTIGVPTQVGARSVHPVVQQVRAARVEPRCVFIGNAAQTLHPVAGQGLNLGLRDAWDLAELWRASGEADPGAHEVLARFAARRRLDASAAIALTNALVSGFAIDLPGAVWLRGAAMAALDLLPPARRFFARRMIFGSSAIP